jgi:hypothetical protein
MMASDEPVKIESEFKRVVTFCLCEGSTRRDYNIGLLFVDEVGPTISEIERLMQSPVLQKFFEGPFFGTVVSWNPADWYGHGKYSSRPTLTDKKDTTRLQRAILVSTALNHFPTPATENDGCPIYLYNEGAIYRFTIGDVYDKCLQMQKFISCIDCKSQDRCIYTNAPMQHCIVEAEQPSLIPTLPEEVYTLERNDWDALKLKAWVSTLEGYTVIPSTATASNPIRPDTPALRPFWQHRFNWLDQAREELSSRAEAGVKTRNTIRTQCAVCYFGGKPHKKVYPCSKWAPRHCEHGMWTEEMLVEKTIDTYAQTLKDTKFTLEDVWRVLFVAGIPFKKDRCLWVVNRLVRARFSYSVPAGGPGIVLSRVSREARFEEETVFSVDALKTWLPEELRNALDNPKPLDRHLLAVAIQLSLLREGKNYALHGGQYGTYSPNIRHVRYEYDQILQGVWGKTFEREHRFHSLNEVYNHYDRLPYFNIHTTS